MSRDGCVALPRGDVGLSAVCDCGISGSYSLTIFKIILDYEYTDIVCSMNELKILNIFKRFCLRKANFMY